MGWPVMLHPDMPVHLTALTVRPRSRRVADTVLHHSDSILNELVELGDLRVLTPDRVVADCLRTMRPAGGVAVADAAVRSGATSIRDVRRMIHAQRAAALRVVAEKVREDDLRGLGLVVVRWDTAQIRHEPTAVARRVAAARSRGALARFTGRLRQGDRWLDLSEHRAGTVSRLFTA